MDREQARDLFSASRDGELSAEEQAAFERFLESDEACRAEYASFCRVIDRLGSLGRAEPPSDFADKVKSRLRRRSGGRLFGASRLAGVPRVPYEIFSLVLILIILTVYLLTVPVRQVPTGAPQAPPSGGASEVER